MVLLTRAAGSDTGTNGVLNEDDLARTLRLPPNLVHDLCLRLTERRLISEGPEGFSLGCDPGSTTLAVVIDAVERDPALDAVHDAGLGQLCPPAGSLDLGATLRELA
jgi:hypothetical protein